MADMRRRMPFPFPGGIFPAELGAVVQRTVLDGQEPARRVIHTDEGDWLVADDRNDPNLPGACVATHIAHVVERNPSVAELASLRPGRAAWREDRGDQWRIEPFTYEDDE